MSAVFLKVLNMSITASWLILAVILARLLLKRAPKWIPCLLWGLVAIRLICPFSFESALSLIPSSETIPADIALQQEPAINSGIPLVNETVNPAIAESFAPAPENSVNPLQIVIFAAAIIWIAGVVIMLAYALFSYLKLKKTVSICVPAGEGVFACDEVKAPFILGVFRPGIYVPSSMSGQTLENVILHEEAHLQRHDHWWKPLGFLLLAVYWFNPLCWIAYILLCRDIEMACDEKVIRDMNKDDIAAYSQALLDCSFPKKRIAACPLAFGEVGVKERVKGVLNYKKPAFWVVLAAIVACIVLAVCLMTNPVSKKINNSMLLPPVDGAVWGMSEEDAKDGIGLETYDIVSEDAWNCNYQKEIQEVYGKPAVVGLSFSRTASQGLSYVYLEFDSALTDAEIEKIEKDLGQKFVLAENRSVIESQEKVSMLPKEVKDRLKSVRIDLAGAEQAAGDFGQSASERWEALEQTSLVTVTVYDNLIRFDAELLTSAILCQDKESYEAYYSAMKSLLPQ